MLPGKSSEIAAKELISVPKTKNALSAVIPLGRNFGERDIDGVDMETKEKVSAVYNRAQRLSERKKMMQAWIGVSLRLTPYKVIQEPPVASLCKLYPRNSWPRLSARARDTVVQGGR